MSVIISKGNHDNSLREIAFYITKESYLKIEDYGHKNIAFYCRQEY